MGERKDERKSDEGWKRGTQEHCGFEKSREAKIKKRKGFGRKEV